MIVHCANACTYAYMNPLYTCCSLWSTKQKNSEICMWWWWCECVLDKIQLASTKKLFVLCSIFSTAQWSISRCAWGNTMCMYIKDILRTHIHTYVLNVFALAIFTTIYFLFIYYLSRRFNLTCKNYSSAIFSGKKKMLVSGAATAPVSSIYICRSAYTCTNVQYIQNTHAYIFSISRGEHNDRVRWWYTHLCNKRKKAKKNYEAFVMIEKLKLYYICCHSDK